MSAPPPPPAEENKKGKENFWFLLPRPQGADEARIIGRQDYQQNTFELRPVDTAGNKKRSFWEGFEDLEYIARNL
ncbi:MAG: hypothetical protein EXS50_00330 [Candidatus Taylorbacteria bacterium]|nr:hypothetical protein [Candidatus Taylorbacteria bacterium]